MASFKSAFASARKAGKKTFNWEGKSYTTELASSSAPSTSKRPTTRSGAATSSAPETSRRPNTRSKQAARPETAATKASDTARTSSASTSSSSSTSKPSTTLSGSTKRAMIRSEGGFAPRGSTPTNDRYVDKAVDRIRKRNKGK